MYLDSSLTVQGIRVVTTRLVRRRRQHHHQQQYPFVTENYKQRRGFVSLSLSNMKFLPTPQFIMEQQQRQQEQPNLRPAWDHVFKMVQQHDPVGRLAGQLLWTPSAVVASLSSNLQPHHRRDPSDMRVTYFATRSFWVETGLRMGSTAKVPPHSAPHVQLQWWKDGIEEMYQEDDDTRGGSTSSSTRTHPTFQLLAALHRKHNFSKCHFDDILEGRFMDLDLKQYPDMKALDEHAERSCGSLMQLTLESSGIREEEYPNIHLAAKFLGRAHGLTNALRTSIPVMSTTGKLIIPQDLCTKYGVRTPRYLLSALGQGDVECLKALRMAVHDISDLALSHLHSARELRLQIVQEIEEKMGISTTTTTTSSKDVMKVFLPGLASETFLKRLEDLEYDLTNRNLRNVSLLEHMWCSGRMIHASLSKQY